MEKESLCKCNKCETTLIDENPQINAKLHPVNVLTQSLIFVKVGKKKHNEYAWVCPICGTDAYLIDL